MKSSNTKPEINVTRSQGIDYIPNSIPVRALLGTGIITILLTATTHTVLFLASGIALLVFICNMLAYYNEFCRTMFSIDFLETLFRLTLGITTIALATIPLDIQLPRHLGSGGLLLVLAGVALEYCRYRRAKNAIDRMRTARDALRKETWKPGQRDACVEAAEGVDRGIRNHIGNHDWTLAYHVAQLGMGSINHYYELRREKQNKS